MFSALIGVGVVTGAVEGTGATGGTEGEAVAVFGEEDVGVVEASSDGVDMFDKIETVRDDERGKIGEMRSGPNCE